MFYCIVYVAPGKTEISVESISYFLGKGFKVAYAIARKEVVIELTERFKNIFSNANVVGVYGGHHEQLFGDLIVCTTHQLYRYYKTFDLLILDEVDAFPLKGNETLMNISLNSSKGRVIFSTATIDDNLNRILQKRNYVEVKLYTRPSHKPLIIPKVIYLSKLMHIIYLVIILHRMANQCIIFTPNKKLCKTLYKIYSHLFSCIYVYADLEERQKNIMDFKNKKYKFIFATTVLERGITIHDVNVIVLDFKQGCFDESSLIQMTGRVGRNYKNPYGYAYILSTHVSKEIENCVNNLREANGELSIL